jgi:peptidoglycan/xylan/chitin deacetylase (PgdA/CDA1 family)
MRVDELIRGPERPTRAQLLQRRRVAAALVSVASVALLLGVLVGAGGQQRRSRRAAAPEIGWYGHLRTLGGGGRRSLDFEERTQESRAIDRALARTPFVRMAGRQHRLIALTFDDGPGPYTSALLAQLMRLRIPGTFFVVGYQLPAFAAALRREVDLGVPIGDHTVHHANLRGVRSAGQRAEILGWTRELAGYGVPAPRLFRPPYGAYDQTTHAILGRQRMLSVLWSIDSEDYTKPGVGAIVRNVVGSAKPGAIVLMHDGGGDRSATVASLDATIRSLERRGYRFAPA